MQINRNEYQCRWINTYSALSLKDDGGYKNSLVINRQVMVRNLSTALKNNREISNPEKRQMNDTDSWPSKQFNNEALKYTF